MSTLAIESAVAVGPILQLHLEPDAPIEVSELTEALDALSHQYQIFATAEGHARPGVARLLVSNVAPGSIDINFVPDLGSLGALVGPMLDQLELLTKFAEQIRRLIDVFRRRDTEATDAGGDVTIGQCEDAINITAPIANHGGTQTLNIINGPVVQNIHIMNQAEAREVSERAQREKARLQSPQSERRQRVSMIWKRLDRDPAATEGRSPDKGLIEEIDTRPKAVLFTDEMAHLKDEMIADEENPYQKVYFVDVEISRVNNRITAYRVFGYHGKDDFTED